MNLKTWLEQNNIAHNFENDYIVNIDEFGTCQYIGESDKIFDSEFNLIIDFEPTTEYLIYSFGNNFFYVKSDETQKVELQILKWVGRCSKKSVIDYAHLGVRASYELLNGSGLYSDYVKKAKYLKHSHLGICEYNTLAGVLVFQSACKDGDIKPIIGETVSLKLDTNVYRDIKLYVTSDKGWRNLLRIHSTINVFNEERHISIEQLNKFSEDIVCILGNDFDFKFLSDLKFKNLYYQIDTVEYRSDKKDLEHLQNIKNYFENYSDKIKPVLIHDSFYIDKDFAKVKKLLNAVGNVKFQNESLNQHYKNIDEILEFEKLIKTNKYKQIFNESIANTYKIVELCENFEIDTKAMKLPAYNLKESEKHYKDSEELFHAMIEDGFQRKIAGKVEDEQVYRDRIAEEVRVIKAGGFVDYFLILWDVMIYCVDNDILTGIGRGSAGGSLVSYLLEIIHLDPIKYNLLFERFLNEGRFNSVPDIDCDFEGLRRDDVKRYMESRFGIHSVASIGSYTTIKVKSGLKDIGRALGYDHKEINFITSMLNKDSMDGGAGEDIMHFFKACQVNDKIKAFAKKNVDLINTIMILLRNHRASSVHASGVLVVPHHDSEGNEMEIYDWLPVRKTEDGILITEWEGIYIDKAKFVKEDILGIAQLDKWSYTLKLIEQHTGKKINVHKDIPIDDEETYRMFSIGFNDDVFQFGSDAQKSYSIEVQPENIEHLIAMNALYRPGPMESNAHVDFYKIKRGDKEPDIDTGMEDITGPTYGLWVYQEQIMQAYRMITDITLAETDQFRKFVVKVKWYKHLFASEYERYHSMFINGYQKKCGVTEEYAQNVWDKIVAFATYGFNRSHAAAYALTGYYCQYLKVHYPLQFWTTSLEFSTEKDIHKRISEINRSHQNIELMPPSANKSEHKFYSDPNTGKIYWSFTKIKYCGSKAIEIIIEDREKNGEYYSLEEFISRVPKRNVNKRTVQYMIMAGAFDEMENIETPVDRIKLIKEHARISGHSVADEYKQEQAKHDFWWLVKQREACGFGYIKFDKLLRRNRIRGKYLTELEFIQSNNSGRDVAFGGIVQFINKKRTRRGDDFAELKCEVNNEIIFVTVWPEQYEKYQDIINSSLNKIILLTGTVDYNSWKKANVLMTNHETELLTFEI